MATTTKPDKNSQVKEITEKLEAGIRDIFTSEKYLEYLKTLSKFHQYSLRNTLLIHQQRPGATRIAGFNTWKKEFNRNVKKGEKGIRILAPIIRKIKKETEKIDLETHAPLLDKDGNTIMVESEIVIPRFKVVSVFDVKQTEGEPLASFIENISGDVRQFEAESVSYTVCQYYNIETGANSFAYLANWSGNKELSELKASLETIRNYIFTKSHIL